jgi:hypothetical protein
VVWTSDRSARKPRKQSIPSQKQMPESRSVACIRQRAFIFFRYFFSLGHLVSYVTYVLRYDRCYFAGVQAFVVARIYRGDHVEVGLPGLDAAIGVRRSGRWHGAHFNIRPARNHADVGPESGHSRNRRSPRQRDGVRSSSNSHSRQRDVGRRISGVAAYCDFTGGCSARGRRERRSQCGGLPCCKSHAARSGGVEASARDHHLRDRHAGK